MDHHGERLEKLRARDKKQARFSYVVVFAAILAVVATSLYLFWPYPRVTVYGEPKIVGSSEIPNQGIVIWEREKVCIPEGVTEVRRYFEQVDEPNQNLQIRVQIPSFEITTEKAECLSPSITPLDIPSYISPGEWVVRIETRTFTPFGGSRDSLSFSPPFTVLPKPNTRSQS